MILCLTEKKPEIQESLEKKEVSEMEGSKEEEQEEGEECSISVETDLTQMEERWREQCTVNDNLKLLLSGEEQRFKVQLCCLHSQACTN